MPDHAAGHLFADDCQALLEVDFDQIISRIDKVNPYLAIVIDFITRRTMKFKI